MKSIEAVFINVESSSSVSFFLFLEVHPSQVGVGPLCVTAQNRNECPSMHPLLIKANDGII